MQCDCILTIMSNLVYTFSFSTCTRGFFVNSSVMTLLLWCMIRVSLIIPWPIRPTGLCRWHYSSMFLQYYKWYITDQGVANKYFQIRWWCAKTNKIILYNFLASFQAPSTSVVSEIKDASWLHVITSVIFWPGVIWNEIG